MRYRFFPGMVAVMLVVAGGCGRDPIPVPPPSPGGEIVPAGAAQAGRPAAVPAVPVDAGVAAVEPVPDAAVAEEGLPPVTSGDGVRIQDEAEATIAVRAITDVKAGELRVGVVSRQTGKSVLLSLGHEVNGYKLIGYDAAKDMVVFELNGEKVGLFLSSSPVTAGDGGEPPIIGPAAGVVVDGKGKVMDPGSGKGVPAHIGMRDLMTDKFTPTDKEIESGIDPNDASTWPEGYRGPVIERLIEKQRAAGIEPETAPPGIFPPAGP